MRKIKAFMYVFQKSLSSIKYYREIIEQNFVFSLKYFIVLVILVSIATTTYIVSPLIPKIKSDINMLLDETAAAFPEDLIISIKEGKLSINRTEPYIIALPKELDAEDAEADKFENILVIDTKGTLEDLDKYATVVLVNESNIISRSESGKIETYPLSGFPDKEFTHAGVEEALQKLPPLTNLFLILITIIIFIGILIFNIVFRAIYLVIVSLVFMAVGSVRGLNFNFAQNYQIAIHSMTLPLIADSILLALHFTIPLPLWFFALHTLFGMVVIFVLSEANKQD